MTFEEAKQVILNDEPIEDIMLDYLIAKSEGFRVSYEEGTYCIYDPARASLSGFVDWNFLMPILEREKLKIDIVRTVNQKFDFWYCCEPLKITDSVVGQTKDSAMEALKRCIIKKTIREGKL